jgi:hypothetical protein
MHIIAHYPGSVSILTPHDLTAYVNSIDPVLLQQSLRDIHSFKFYCVANISTLQQHALPTGDSAAHHGQYIICALFMLLSWSL